MILINTALLALTVGTTLGTPGDINCTFATQTDGRATLNVALRPTPSLRDLPGLFRVKMRVGTRPSVQATAQPNLNTKANDIALTARGSDDLIYALVLDQSGQAALNIRLGGTTASETLFGTCLGAKPHIERWLQK